MKVPPALVTQRQFRKAHGDRLAAELDLDKLGYPVINHRNGTYWILDGQHRVYALRQNGFEKDTLDCEVYEDLTDAEMADIFLGRDERRAISPFDKFHVACTAGHRRECDIRRVVEGLGLRIAQGKSENSIGAVSALCDLYDRSDEQTLTKTVRTLKRAFQGDPNSYDASLISGVGLVYNRYNRISEDELVSRMSSIGYGVRGLLRRAAAQREKMGGPKGQCVASVLVDVYNRGMAPRSMSRLAPWWKEAEL